MKPKKLNYNGNSKVIAYIVTCINWLLDLSVSGLSDVELTDLSDGQILKYDNTEEKWINANETGGTEVEANPQGTPTDTLNTISIDGVIYGIEGGGGGGGTSYDETALYVGTTPVNTYDLSDNLSNYDLIYVYSINDTGYVCCTIFRAEDLTEAIGLTDRQFGVCNDSEYEYFRVSTDNQLASFAKINRFITKVYGIKYTSGGGGASSELIELSPGDDTASRTFQLSKTPSMIVMSYFEGNDDSGWSSQYVLIWGSARAYGTGTGTPTSTYGESKTVGVTYGADGKSFTINAANAGSALNTNTGHGYLLCFYDAGGGSGASNLSDLSDVDLTNLSDGQILQYNSTSEKWENADNQGGGSSLPFEFVIDENDNGINIVYDDSILNGGE